MNETLLKVLFLVALLPGIVGTILPFVPGLLYMLLVGLLFSFFVFHFSLWIIAAWVVLAVIAVLVEHFAGAASTRYFGGSKRSLLLGAGALFVGTLLVPPFGGLVAMFAAVFLSEMAEHSSKKQAFKAATGSVAGSLAGRLVLFGLALIFFLIAFLAVLF